MVLTYLFNIVVILVVNALLRFKMILTYTFEFKK